MPALPKLIGFAGLKGSGKDTAAAVLIKQFGYERRPFAGPLKSMLRAMLIAQGADLNLIERMLEGDLKDAPSAYLNGCTTRHAMQTLGTEWGRKKICEDYWVDAWIRSLGGASKIVVTDVRFLNEAKLIQKTGGVLVYIERTGQLAEDMHDSEQNARLLKETAALRVINGFQTAAAFQEHICKILQSWEVDVA